MSRIFASIRSSFTSLLRAPRFVAHALKNTQRDYTRGSLRSALMLLAIPMVLEMLTESLFAVVDIYFVSSLGAYAVASVGLTEAIITLVYAIAIGLSIAITAMVARRIGAGDVPGANRVAAQAMWVGMFISALIGGSGILFGADILRLMGASTDVIADGTPYTRVLLGGSATIMYLFLLNAIFRGAGDASVAMRSLTLANGINMILDPCLIFGWGPFPELGLTGAAVATTIGRGVAVLYQLQQLSGGHSRIHLHWNNIALHGQDLLALLRISAGGVMQFFIATSSWVILMWIVAGFGSAAVAGYTIAIRVVIFTILPAWGLGNATATLVGQNLGNKNPTRAEQSVWLAAKLNAIFLAAASVVFIVWANPIIGVFTHDPQVLQYGTDCLRLISYGFFIYAIGMIMIHAFNGAGDTSTPTYVYFFSHWLLQIPLALYLAYPAELGPNGVFIAALVAESMLTVVTVILFRRGRWKLKKIGTGD